MELVQRNRARTDAELVEQFLGGEVEAFNVLVRRWEREIYQFVLPYVGNREDARDLCQQTFIKAYYKIPGLRDPQKFSTWLYQIAVNTCHNSWKRRRRHPTVSLEGLQDGAGPGEELPEMAAEPSTHPDVAAQEGDVRALVQKALQAIPEEQRAVIVMKEYQGMKFSQIAEVLRVSVNTVKSRMYYGLSALKKIFEKWNIDEETL